MPGGGGKRARGRAARGAAAAAAAPAGHGRHQHQHQHLPAGTHIVVAAPVQVIHSQPPPHHHVHHGQAAVRPPQRVVAPKRQPPAVVSARPCSGEQRGTPATMALIAHQDGPPYPGEEAPEGPRQNRRRPGQAAHVRGDHRQENRRTRYLLLGATCMIPGLILYFGGGYLFVSAYNARYPFVEISVDAALIR